MRRRDLLRNTVAAGLGASAARLLGAGEALLPFVDDVQAAGRQLRVPSGLVGPLIATPATVVVWPGYPTTLQTFDATYPSPTIRVRRGDTFDVLLENQLSEPTNVHWHGLAVPPEADGHPMDVVQPGDTKRYTFQVEERAGTYWYHPHPDRRTAAQVYGGMAGFFLVEDDDELALGLPTGAYDVPLLLQDRRFTADGSFLYAPTMMDMMHGYLGDSILANGVPDAEMQVAAGAYRFRLLNGSNARVFRVAFEDRRVFQVIAGDGGLLDRPVAATEFFLGPAERAEIYVDFSRSESHRSPRLVSLPFSGGGGTQGAPFTLLRFAVRGSGPAPPLPNRLVRVPDLGTPVIRRRFVMDMRLPPVMGNFWINGRSFRPDRVIAQINRGLTEAWTVSNLSVEPHPFHVHATQFKVLSRTSGPLGPHELGLKDTILVWPGEIVQLAVRFDRHPGMFVLHCHNLEHEDMGMMANFELL